MTATSRTFEPDTCGLQFPRMDASFSAKLSAGAYPTLLARSNSVAAARFSPVPAPIENHELPLTVGGA
jgi:hypothetical protein